METDPQKSRQQMQRALDVGALERDEAAEFFSIGSRRADRRGRLSAARVRAALTVAARACLASQRGRSQ